MALMGRAFNQAQKFGVEMAIPDEAVTLECGMDPLHLKLASGERVRTRAAVIATGATYRRLDVEGLDLFEGSSVHYWASPMEGSLCANEEVALVGGGNSAGQAVVYLAGQANKVWLLTRRPLAATMSHYLVDRIEQLPNVEVVDGVQVASLEGEGGALSAIGWRNLASGEETTAAGAPSLLLHRRRPQYGLAGPGRDQARRARLPADRRGGGRGPAAAGDEPARRVRGRRRARLVGQTGRGVGGRRGAGRRLAPRLARATIRRNSLTVRTVQTGVENFQRPREGASDMAGIDDVKEGMEVIGADGVHVGTVDRIEGDRIKLTKKDSGQGSHEGHHHYLSRGLVAEVEGEQVRLSANADVAVSFEEEEG